MAHTDFPAARTSRKSKGPLSLLFVCILISLAAQAAAQKHTSPESKDRLIADLRTHVHHVLWI